MRYRPDIDGLRAIAVIPVLLFHTGTPGFDGGYVGVDIFFVISGAVIGSVIAPDIRAGQFSVINFYERRVRRILPAFLFMLGGTYILSYIYAVPRDLAELGRSGLSALLVSSNMYFWRKTGYFDIPAEDQPLLHTWSLSVEEQFYLSVPLMLLAVHRWLPHRLPVAVIGLAALSLALSIFATDHFPTANFYLLPTRAWELLLGILLALGVGPRLASRTARDLAAGGGLLLIVLAVSLYGRSTPFPGTAALLPCLGAALIIAAGRSDLSLVGRLLSTRPLVFIGLISYPLYLWHWPIIVFQRSDSFLGAGRSPVAETMLILAASFVMAIFSWRFIERPFRSPAMASRTNVFERLGAATAAVLLIGITADFSSGLPGRFPARAQTVAAYLDYEAANQYRAGTCMISSGFTADDFDEDECLTPAANRRNYLIFGDSHAAHLWWGLQAILPDVNMMQATSSGCKPFYHPPPGSWRECTRLIGYVFHEFLRHNRVDRVILAARWTEEDLPALRETLEAMALRQVPVVLIGPIVQYNAAVPKLLANAIRFGDRRLLDENRVGAIADLDAKMQQIAEETGTQYVSLWDAMCAYESCLAVYDGKPMQFDYGHVTAEGSVRLARLILEGWRPVTAPPAGVSNAF